MPSPGGKVTEHKRGRMRNAGGSLSARSIYQPYSLVGSAAIPLPPPTGAPSPRERALSAGYS